MPRELILQQPREVVLRSYEEAPLSPDQVRARALVSGISHGTEMNLYRGTSPFASKAFDPDLRLFRDRPAAAFEPAGLGYDWVGRVTDVGAAVTDFRPGDLVHLPYPHRETQTFTAGVMSPFGTGIGPLRADLDSDRAILLMLAGVAMLAVHDGRVKVGDRVAVFGLGAIGLMAVQLAKLNGAAWVDAVDLYPGRRALAERYGADRALDPGVGDVGVAIKAGETGGADVAIELSGSYRALHEAIRSVRKGGTVVAGGFYYGDASGLRLGEEFHHNRVTLISTIGAWDNPHRDYPLWNRDRIYQTSADMLASGRLRTDDMITHRFPFTRAADAYRLIAQTPEETVKVVLTY